MTRMLRATFSILMLGLLATPMTAGATDLADFFASLTQDIPNVATTASLVGPSGSGSVANPVLVSLADFNPVGGLDNLSSATFQQFQNFPLGASVAAFTYTFNPQLNVFERSLEALGPVLSERAGTTGRGKFNVAFGYSYADFTTIQGTDLDSIPVPLAQTTPLGVTDGQVIPTPGNTADVAFFDLPALGPDNSFAVNIDSSGFACEPVPSCSNAIGTGDPGSYALQIDQFPDVFLDAEIKNQIFAFFFNYGITDKIDIGAVLPVIYTKLKGQTRINYVDALTGSQTTAFGQRKTETRTGIGDIVLRAKWNAFDSEWVDLAMRGDLFLPSGNPEQLRGYGNVAFQPMLIASNTFWRFGPYLNVAGFFLVGDKYAQQFRYSLGTDVRIIDRLSGVVEFVGSHDFIENDFGDNQYNIAVGFKFNPWRRMVLSASAIFRLNDEGLRATAIPSASIEYTFF